MNLSDKNQQRIEELDKIVHNFHNGFEKRQRASDKINALMEGAANEREEFLAWLKERHASSTCSCPVNDCFVMKKIKELEQ